ncbi:MAG TPA: tetratricopeptide repeat protein [Nannocystaceae bacterium]|nr:tetratricopeptide repeat protein [Nannocystaceae bacterium]
MPKRSRERLSPLLGAALLVALACRPATSTKSPVTSDQRASVDPKAADPREHSGAADRPAELAQPQGEKLRERPAPATVEGRDAALAAVTHGNPEGAIAALAPIVDKTPDDLEARFALARAHATVGALDEARAVLEDKRGAPLDISVVQLRVAVHRTRGQYAEAEKLLEEALKKHKDALPLLGDLLQLRVETGRKDDARSKAILESLYDAYDAGKVKTAADMLAVGIAALARGGKGGFHDANMVLEEAEMIAPVAQGEWVGDRVRLLRGAVFLEKYAGDEAATTFGLILERDPWHPEALAGMAMVHVEGLRFAQASRAATEALAVNPKHAEAHTVIARIALIEGRRDEAREHAEKHALARHPSHEPALAVLAASAISSGDRKAYTSWRDRRLAVNPKDGGFFKDLSDILGFLHLYPEADEVLKEGVALAPSDPYVQSAYGLNLLRLGDEKGGRAALEKAWKGDPFNERTRNTLDLYEKSIDSKYSLETVGDLIVRLPTDDRQFVQPGLVASAESSKRALDGFYKVKAGKLRLEFFATPDEFSVRTVGVPSLGAVAVCFGPVITFIGPYFGAVNLDLVMRHEMAHVYAIRRSKGRVPRWFTEGLSEWESEQADPAWARESAVLLSEAKKHNKLRKLSELELAFIRAESPVMMEAAYSTAAYAIRYLATTYGRDKLALVLDGYAAGKDTPELFEQHFGKPLATIEREFETWFTEQLAAKLSGWTPTGDAKKDDAREALWKTAQEQLQEDKTEEGLRTVEKLIQKGGDGFMPRMLAAQVILAGNNPSLAKRHLQAAAKFNKESIEPYVRMAELARKGKDVVEEKRVLREALAIDADSLDPAARLVMLALVTDDKDNLAYARARAGALAPLHPLVLAARGLELQKAGKSADAKAFVQRAGKALADVEGKGPIDTTIVVALARAATGDKDGAKTLAKQALAGDIPEPAKKKLQAL